jgi:hypothetical protein
VAKTFLENVDKALGTIRAEAKAPSELIEAKLKLIKPWLMQHQHKPQPKTQMKKQPLMLQKPLLMHNKRQLKLNTQNEQQLAILEKSNWDVKNLKSQISDQFSNS